MREVILEALREPASQGDIVDNEVQLVVDRKRPVIKVRSANAFGSLEHRIRAGDGGKD